MLYLSLALIFLGILIFLFSIILDAKRRHESQHAAPARGAAAVRQGAGAAQGAKEGPGAGPAPSVNRGQKAPRDGSVRAKVPAGEKAQSSRREQKAVLYEDKSNVIDYTSESGSIDPSLEKYRNIKRIGEGTISVETGGITFYMGKKLYRYDFHRVRDIKAGAGHLALFLMGSGSIKLFIIEPGSAVITAAADAFREYVRSSA